MGDSDEEYSDRRRGRDKFRRERNDNYERRDDRRRENWEDRGGRENWGRRDNRQGYGGRDYDRGNRRERFSPGRHDISPPQKRMRRDWDGPGGGGFSHFEGAPYGGGNMHGQHHGGDWNPGQGDMGSQQHHFGGDRGPGNRGPEMDFPTQPPMQTFKQFLSSQDDNISDEDAIKKFNEYKVEFKRQQINEFFLAHKDEEWFKTKYHPEECGKRKEDSKNALLLRRDIYMKLSTDPKWMEGVSVTQEAQERLIRMLDAAVILMEGGTEFDLHVLDQIEENRQASESQPAEKGPPEASEETEEGEDISDRKDETPEKQENKETSEKISDDSVNGQESKKSKKRKRDYDYDSGSESDSGSDSDGALPDEDDEPIPPGINEAGETTQNKVQNPPGLDMLDEEPKEKESKEEEQKDEKEEDTAEEKQIEKEVKVEKSNEPRGLHQTNSIFLRNLAPTITKQEVEAMCKRYPGFMRVALQDPQPERRFVRRGWVTFDRTVNIKDICWNLNNIRLRDCEMGAIVNRELKQRVRPVSGITVHKGVVRQDIKHAAKIIQIQDAKWNIWEESVDQEKTDQEKQLTLGLVSKNPVLKNITDYLVEEGSYEEEELLGVSLEPQDSSPEITVEKDEEFLQVLDRMILYLRIVHSFDYYCAVEYPNEDEMPHRCGIIHGRGPTPLGKITQPDVNDWNAHLDNKLRPFMEVRVRMEEEEVMKIGRKDPEAEVEKFVTANTQELAKDKWLCPISGKKFKGPEFVRKHIFNKHGEKVDEVKTEVAYFNNYLMDPKRPQLPENPGNRPYGGPPRDFQGPGEGYNRGPPGGMMGGYQSRPYQDRYRGGDRGFNRGGDRRYNRGHYQNNYHGGRGSDNFRRDQRQQRDNPMPRRDRSRADPRNIIEYRDLDAPDGDDIF